MSWDSYAAAASKKHNSGLHKFHDAPVQYPTMHHFVTGICIVRIFLSENGALGILIWCIVWFLGWALLIRADKRHLDWNPIDQLRCGTIFPLTWMYIVTQRTAAPLLCYFELCAAFHRQQWIQTGVTVWKRAIWVKFGDCLSPVTLKFERWPWKTRGHLSYPTLSFVYHFVAIC